LWLFAFHDHLNNQQDNKLYHMFKIFKPTPGSVEGGRGTNRSANLIVVETQNQSKRDSESQRDPQNAQIFDLVEGQSKGLYH